MMDRSQRQIRQKKIIELHRSGMGFAEIGETVSLGPERVRQIIRAHEKINEDASSDTKDPSPDGELMLEQAITGLPRPIYLCRGKGDLNPYIKIHPGIIVIVEPVIQIVSCDVDMMLFRQIENWIINNYSVIQDFWDGNNIDCCSIKKTKTNFSFI